MRVAPYGRLVAVLALVGGGFSLSGCSLVNEFLPPTEPQEFVVTGSIADVPTPFRNSEPGVENIHAREICANGFEKLGEDTQPTDQGEINQVRVRCAKFMVTPVPLPIPFP